jgi:hypothetical protein
MGALPAGYGGRPIAAQQPPPGQGQRVPAIGRAPPHQIFFLRLTSRSAWDALSLAPPLRHAENPSTLRGAASEQSLGGAVSD